MLDRAFLRSCLYSSWFWEYQAYLCMVHHLISNCKSHNYSCCNSELFTVYIIYNVKSICMCLQGHAIAASMCMEEEKKKQAMFSSTYLYAMAPSPYKMCVVCIMWAVL